MYSRHAVLLEKMRGSFGQVIELPLIGLGSGGWGNSSWFDTARALVFVVSPTFEGMDDGHRQLLVWGKLLEDFTPEERSEVEFVSTRAPSELKANDLRCNHFETIAEPSPHG